MIRQRYIILAVLFSTAMILATACSDNARSAGSSETGSRQTEPAQVFNCTSSGRWFPGNSNQLRSMVNGFLDDAERMEIKGKPLALISPHAGYVYSGPVAAAAYKQIEGLHYDTVVVIGFTHGVYDPDIGVFKETVFRTPLGDIPVDDDIIDQLIAQHKNIRHKPALFYNEHSVDNQLPFLQSVLSDFKLVPILIGSQTPENIRITSSALRNVLKNKNALIVASTDMSHYWPQETAKQLDTETLRFITALDADGIAKLMTADPSGRRLCGYGAVQSAINTAKGLGADSAVLVRHATSQEITGMKSDQGVVGYSAVVISNSKLNPVESNSESPNEYFAKEKKMTMPEYGGELDEAAQKELLEIARNSLDTYIKTGKLPDITPESPLLNNKRGVFVTLNKHGMLRGCMGYFENDTPLYKIVPRQASVSATGDPRFPSVRENELEDIDIEISVLSVPEYVDSYEDIVVGKHGVILEKGYHRATFLPQVAPEQGWDRDTMLAYLSAKAGLAADAWKKGCRFQVYTAQVFGEQE
ncbi:MAG TPA: AmmeMemoRadiSam system protein B [bacterium]|nr:AmmeMemoRadiSam system protein B [bacterium]